MADPDYFLYHFGWVIGVGWLVVAVGQILLGLEGRAATDLDLWGTYAWLGAAQFVLGAAWLGWWYAMYRPRFHDQKATG